MIVQFDDKAHTVFVGEKSSVNGKRLRAETGGGPSNCPRKLRPAIVVLSPAVSNPRPRETTSLAQPAKRRPKSALWLTIHIVYICQPMEITSIVGGHRRTSTETLISSRHNHLRARP